MSPFWGLISSGVEPLRGERAGCELFQLRSYAIERGSGGGVGDEVVLLVPVGVQVEQLFVHLALMSDV